jgi:hypothetical protein
MATPDPGPDLAAAFNCETPTCKQPYRMVSLFVGDSQAHYHCPGCWMAWNVAIMDGLIKQGIIADPAAAGAPAGT